ncbi:hypothetical protein LCGC14_2594110 [marine sediment metagenome]|uniref:Uncharacterized protein n=1 Tax=marine sediment metagenome TaxID=412755 RepID=A0A0F9CLR8_9ZZZZ
MISKLLKRYQQYRKRREFERDRCGYIANLQAQLDAGLIDIQVFRTKEAQWADRAS